MNIPDLLWSQILSAFLGCFQMQSKSLQLAGSKHDILDHTILLCYQGYILISKN